MKAMQKIIIVIVQAKKVKRVSFLLKWMFKINYNLRKIHATSTPTSS